MGHKYTNFIDLNVRNSVDTPAPNQYSNILCSHNGISFNSKYKSGNAPVIAGRIDEKKVMRLSQKTDLSPSLYFIN